MKSQSEFPQKRNRKSLVWIFSFVGACLLALFMLFIVAPVEGHQGVSDSLSLDENGYSAEEDDPENRALLNSAVILYVASDDPAYEDYGLGTVVGEQSILTAKHVGSFRVGTQPDLPGLRINDLAITGTISVTYSYLQGKGVSSGTDLMKIDLPLSYSGSFPADAQIASQEAIDSIAVGDWVSIVYWEDETSQTRVGKFKVLKISDGMIMLDDPGRIINPGDSGGGAFYNGALIGVTHSIVTVISSTLVDGKVIEQEEQAGKFWITLISPAFR